MLKAGCNDIILTLIQVRITYIMLNVIVSYVDSYSFWVLFPILF